MREMEDDRPLTGIITDIQRYSVHDGPGIRTLVFFKGCPLKCQWCQNPETWQVNPELMFYPDRCIGCRLCAACCPVQAAHGVWTDREKCRECGLCARVCPAQARNMAGREYTLREVMDIVARDKIFYDHTGGGVTLSGGEPTRQGDFVLNLLDALKRQRFHTAMETCGHCRKELFVRMAERLDCILFDVKHMDDAMHRRYTGVSNRQLLDNLAAAGRMGRHIVIRVPLIPGVNDSESNIRKVTALAWKVGAKEIHLLPFHQAGEEKWRALGRRYPFADCRLMEEEKIEAVRSIIEEAGIPVDVGGNGIYKPNTGKRRENVDEK